MASTPATSAPSLPQSSLTTIPLELQHQIIRHLSSSYASTLALWQTNHHFHAQINLRDTDRNSRITYLYHLQRQPRHRYRRYVCFGCLKLRAKTLFLRYERRRPYLFWGKEGTRLCLICQGVRTEADGEADGDWAGSWLGPGKVADAGAGAG